MTINKLFIIIFSLIILSSVMDIYFAYERSKEPPKTTTILIRPCQ